MQARRNIARWAAVAVLAGCAAPPPPPPPPTVVKLSLVAAPDVNGAAPIIVRVYQLAATAGFEKAEFFKLFNADQATLGPDMVKRDEYLLAPGTTKDETLTVPDRVQALGVLAAYRSFQTLTWRVVLPVPPNKTTPLQVRATAAGLVAGP